MSPFVLLSLDIVCLSPSMSLGPYLPLCFSVPASLPVCQAEEMINGIRSAFKESLDKLAWMDDQTKQAAKDKVGGDCVLY